MEKFLEGQILEQEQTTAGANQPEQVLTHATAPMIDDFFINLPKTSGGSTQTNLLEMIYPIGSIYMSMRNVSPANFLGGTWTRVANGRMLVGVNENDSDFNTVRRTGGSKTGVVRQHSHGIGAHNHTIPEHGHAHNISATASSNSVAHHHRIPDLRPATGHRFAVNNGGTISDRRIINTSIWANDNNSSGHRVPVITAGNFFNESVVAGNDTGSHNINHNHTVTVVGSIANATAFSTQDNTNALSTTPTGTTPTNDNLPPYITCFMWERTG